MTLDPRDIVLFMKRLRKKYGPKIRFLQCGEYGDQLNRPHHHILLFGFRFSDEYLWRKRDGYRFTRSDSLEKLWRLGNCEIGDVTFESAAYVARYITKKITGEQSYDHYGSRIPEYITMSRRPGIASAWYDKFKSDVYPRDEIVTPAGYVQKPPRYYDKLFDLEIPSEMERIKNGREMRARAHSHNNTTERLAVRQEVQLARCKKLIRGYENGIS